MFPENISPEITLEENTINVAPLLINPKDEFVIRIVINDVDENEGSFTVSARIVGVNKIMNGDKSRWYQFMWFIAGTVLLVGGMVILIVSKEPEVPVPTKPEKIATIVGVALGAIGYLLILMSLVKNKKVRRVLKLFVESAMLK